MKLKVEQLFVQWPLVADKIMSFLSARELVTLGACCKLMRQMTNRDILWHRIAKGALIEQYEYLLQQQAHSLVSSHVERLNAIPLYKPIVSDTLSTLCHWRQVFNRYQHLKRNWTRGVYLVAPMLKGHRGRIVDFDCNGSVIVSGSNDDKLIKVWSIEELCCENTFRIKSNTLTCLKIYKNNQLLTGSEEGIVKMYNYVTGDCIGSLSYTSNNNACINKMIKSHNEEYLVAILSDNSLKVWHLDTRKLQHIMRGHTEDIECLELTDNNMAITGSWDNTIILWNISSGHQLLRLWQHTEVINCLAIDMSRALLVSGSSDSTLIIWSVHQTHNAIVLHGHESDVYCVRMFGEHVCSSGADSQVIVWCLLTGCLLHKLTGAHLGVVRFLYMDECKLVSAGDAKKIIVWNYKDGKMLNEIHRNPIKLNIMWINDTKIVASSPDATSHIAVILYW